MTPSHATSRRLRGGGYIGHSGSGPRGFALLVMLILVVMGSMFAVTRQLEFVSRKYAQDEVTQQSLALAKEALIGYAMTYRDNYSNDVFGYLPCPDSTGDGQADANDGTQCSNTVNGNAAIGLLPYKTLGLPDLRDSEGVCLFYAVSGRFKAAATKYTPLNWDTQGQFSIVGTNVAPDQGDGGATAVIFAAGVPLSGQSRSVNGSYPCQIDPSQVATFLDGNYNFASSSTIAITPGDRHSTTNNDQVKWITPREIFDKVAGRADFSNAASATPAGQVNTLSDGIKALLEKKIQDDVVAGTTSNSAPINTGSYTQFAGKQIGDLQTGLSLSTTYANYYTNWIEQYRQVTCNPITACLTIAGTACRGALMFAGRSSTDNGYAASGQPRYTAHKTSSTANLNYYFEATGGRALLNSAASAFTGAAAYTAASTSADVGYCLVPGALNTFAQDIASFTRTITSAATPQASISTVAKTVTLGVNSTSSTATGSGCVWYPTQLQFTAMLRAYFRFNITNRGEGFIFAVVDGANNQAALTGGTLCGTTDTTNYGQLGYSATNLLPPKFGVEVDTRTQGISSCSGSCRNDPTTPSPAHHVALVGWGTAASTTDDNYHGAGTLGSGTEPLNPNTRATASVDSPDIAVGTITAASWSNNVVTVTTAAAHTRSTGDQVTIPASGVTAIVPSGYAGTYRVTVIDATHFAYSLASNPGTYLSGGTVIARAGIRIVGDSSLVVTTTATLRTAINTDMRLDAAKSYDATQIVGITWSSGNAMVTTGTGHGLMVGQQVKISGVNSAGPGNYNGTVTILTRPDSTHFSYASADGGNYTSGGLIRPALGLSVASASASSAGSAYAATITTSAAHGFVSGQPVTIAGVSPAGYNGTFQIAVVDATHFTFPLASNPGAAAAGGSVLPAVAITLKAYFNTNFPSCTLTDLQNLSRELSTLCSQQPAVEWDNVYVTVDSVTGLAMATVYAGFTNAQLNVTASNQSIAFSNFIIRSQ